METAKIKIKYHPAYTKNSSDFWQELIKPDETLLI